MTALPYPASKPLNTFHWRRWGPVAFVLPLAVVMLLGFGWPLFNSIVNSFHPYEIGGIDRSTWTLENYRELLDPYFVGVFLRTLRISLIISVITAVLAYPIAFYIVRQAPRVQALVLLIYMAPWLVNVVVKAFGWSLLLAPNGVVNEVLQGAGLIEAPLRLMFNETAIIIGLVHGHFIFVLFPLWAALGGMDPNLRWAAANLGARPRQIFARIILPLTLPALVAGLIINFTMNMAAFATPALLGGARARVISFVTYQINLVNLNWPLGAAMGVALLVLTLTLIWISQRVAASGRRRVVFEGAS